MATVPTGMILQPMLRSSGRSLPRVNPAFVSIAVIMARKSTDAETPVSQPATGEIGEVSSAPIVITEMIAGSRPRVAFASPRPTSTRAAMRR
ncbi:hypothetical protein JRG78_10240 [Microbacterium sp. EF45047]|nr:hypothetical protein JRG78_10240 [Microbacterium sp. EF45047]